MRKLFLLLFFTSAFFLLKSQTDLYEAVDFQVKTVEGETIKLFTLLDDENKLVVIDFFSTACGPCQDYAPDFQGSYEIFNSNNGNTFFMGINTNSDNQEVILFDSIFGLTYPTVSGLQGGGNNVYDAYNILSYPTVIVITPDHQIVEQYIWPPSEENIVNAVYAYGGMVVGENEIKNEAGSITIFPNPVREKAFLSINSLSESTIDFKIMDPFGSVFLLEKIVVKIGVNQIELPVCQLNNGIYFVMVSGSGFVPKTMKFVVAN